MLLAIEQGNTNTLFAVHDGERWIAQWRAATDASRTADEYAVWLAQLLGMAGLSMASVDGRAEKASAALAFTALRSSIANSVLSASMAPRPSDTWSDSLTPMEGRVTAPTTVSQRAVGPVPTNTLSTTCLPSWFRVIVPSSISLGPLR